MNVDINWQTTYTYESEVGMVHTQLRVLPADKWGQRVISSSLTTEPATPVGLAIDAFGNQVHRLGFLGGVSKIRISAAANVETPDGRHGLGEELTPLKKFLALEETARCPFAPEFAELAENIGSTSDPLSSAGRLMDQISARFEYQVGATNVEHTALDFLRNGAGVCQDFAHLMIAVLRMRGIPAFYVSGYLAPPEGVEQSTASHAWVHAYTDGQWYGFDPANNQRQDHRYIAIGVGRDYDDVPPIRGSVRGLAHEEYETTLTVRAEQPQ